MAVQSTILPGPTTAPGTAFAGPLVSGNAAGASPPQGSGPNQGLVILMQQVTLVHNGTSAVSGTMYVPKHSVLLDVLADTTTAWTSATSDTLSVGITAGGTEYASGVDTKSAARVRPTFTAAQLAAMLDTGTNEAVIATVTPVGTAAAGQTTVTLIYAQTANWQT